jgi:DNA-3-methyladenine glycosylase I
MKSNITRRECCFFDLFYIKYHDEEWGVPVHDDRIHFEFIILEGAQAGLSWSTVLKKRENYRIAYHNFDPVRVSEFGEEKIQELLSNEGIIRNKLKIRSSVSNARLFLDIQQEFGSFDNYFWNFVENKPIQNRFENMEDLPARTEISDVIAKDLKKRGFKFMGSTIVYAHMQACGLVNDHVIGCFRYQEIKNLA